MTSNEICPFCNRNPYETFDNGPDTVVAMVNCCYYGILYFYDMRKYEDIYLEFVEKEGHNPPFDNQL